MKNKKIISSLILLFSLVGCNNNSLEPNAFYNKVEGNEDFNTIGNMVESDFEIDGILNNKEWENPDFEINYGGTQLVPAKVNAKLYFGDNGLSVGFSTLDTMIAASQEYNNEHFVVDSDNVEFYIDCQNDKGQIAKPDDFTFLINPEEFAEMRIGTGSYWGPWSGVVDYAVHVEGTINDDSDTDTGWGCELFLPYKTFGFTKDSTIGIAFGCRDKTSNLKTSEWAGWIPDPQIIDTYISINKENGIIKESIGEYNVAAGKFDYDESENVYTSMSTNSLAVHKSNQMRNGTYSADMYLESKGGDNGIIFQVKENDSGLFWEGSGVRYYFFFINFNGDALLAKTNNGTWTHLRDSKCSIKTSDWNNLKVVVNQNTITCFVNGLKVIEYSEKLYDSKIGVGLRSGIPGIKYKNIEISDSIDTGETLKEISGYSNANGMFDYANTDKTLIQASLSNSMIIKKDSNVTDGTLSLKLTPKERSDNGIVFRLNDNNQTSYWENNVSYYFFFISQAGSAYLGRVNNGWANIGEKAIDNFNINQEYELKVVLNGNNIKCYINDTLMIDVNDNTVNGSKCGIRAGSSKAIFSLLTVTNS